MLRDSLVVVHRYVGLAMTVFLIIAGLTGALSVWYSELDRAFNAELMQVEPPPSGIQPLSAFELRERVEAQFPQAVVNWMALQPPRPDSAARFSLEPASADAELIYDEVFVNPYNGVVTGGREWGNLSQGMTNFMPFIYRLHYSLALDKLGIWMLGLVAIFWSLDCFVGAYLTMPRRHKGRKKAASWWQRWWSSWKLRWRGGYQLNFVLHTAASLWLWGLLFIFALSSVALNLYAEVYRPLMAQVLTFQPPPLQNVEELDTPLRSPPIGWQAGYQAANSELYNLATEQGFEVLRLERFSYDPELGLFKLMASTSRDINQRFGQSWLYLDASSGEMTAYYLPSGEAAGDTLTTWLSTLHIAAIWGLPYRILVTGIGLFVVILCVSGLLLWWRKHRARRRYIKSCLD